MSEMNNNHGGRSVGPVNPFIVWRTSENGPDVGKRMREVDEENGLPVGLYTTAEGADTAEKVGPNNPLPTQVVRTSDEEIFVTKIPLSADISWKLGLEGRLFIAADADQNDRVTGQTSFANTTPTFMLNNPITSGVLCIPSRVRLTQTGTVAGGDVFVEIEAASPSAFSSGTLEKAVSGAFGMPSAPAEQCGAYSTVTAIAGYGMKLYHYTLGPDVSPAEGVINNLEYSPPPGLFLWPNSSLSVFTYAASTGPTWDWGIEWYEIPLSWLS